MSADLQWDESVKRMVVPEWKVGHAVAIPSPPANTQAWREHRCAGMGGSDVAAILGLSKWSTRHSVYLEKARGVLPRVSDRPVVMDCGRELERLALRYLADETELDVQAANDDMTLCHPQWDWQRAHIDGFVVDAGEASSIVEAKWAQSMWYEVPVYYLCQAQWYLHVTGLDACYFTVIFANRAWDWWLVERDEEDIELIVDASRRFWQRHVVEGVAPPLDGSDDARRMLLHRWGVEAGDVVQLPPSAEQLLEQRDRVEAELAVLKRTKAQLDNELLDLVGTGREGQLRGWRVKRRISRARNVDVNALHRDHPEAYDACLKLQFDKDTFKKRYPHLARDERYLPVTSVGVRVYEE